EAGSGQNQTDTELSFITLPGRPCMRFKTIEEVLEWTGVFHQHLAEEYQRLSRRQEQQRLDMLLNYLADHERLLQQTMERVREDTAYGLLHTWFDKAPDIPLPGTLVEFSTLCRASDIPT